MSHVKRVEHGAGRMVLEVRAETGEKHGAVTRSAGQLGIGTESLRKWVNQVDIDAGHRPGTSAQGPDGVGASIV